MSLKCVVARKEHVCNLCKRKILIGEKYWRRYDGQLILDHKEHTNCELFKKREVVCD
jgi:hypothetical protein